MEIIKKQLPNATAVMVIGILSVITSLCYGLIGIILGIVALAIAKKDMKAYQENPDGYDNYSNLNTGRICAIVGICVGAVIFIIAIIYILFLFSYMFPFFESAINNAG